MRRAVSWVVTTEASWETMPIGERGRAELGLDDARHALTPRNRPRAPVRGQGGDGRGPRRGPRTGGKETQRGEGSKGARVPGSESGEGERGWGRVGKGFRGPSG